MNKQFRVLIKLFVLLLGLISFSSYSQVQIGQDIIGVEHQGLGEAICLSADGNTLAIGCWSPSNTNYSNAGYFVNGSVRVYAKNEATGQWEQIGDTIKSETNDKVIYGQYTTRTVYGEQLGRTISLSNDGTILAIGARGNDGEGTNAGHVRVFERMTDPSSPGGFKWVQIGNDIDGTQAESLSGFDVSLSGDGDVIAIGAPRFDTNGFSRAGQVLVYRRDDNVSLGWSQVGNAINGTKSLDHLGVSVTLSDDGNTLAMTALNSSVHPRHPLRFLSKGLITKVYQNVDDNWVKLGDDILGEAGNGEDDRGGKVQLAKMGSDIVVAISNSTFDRFNSVSGREGNIRVYKRDASAGTGWAQMGQELSGNYGAAMAISDDALTLAAGYPFTPNPYVDADNFFAGKVEVYKYASNNTWQLVVDFEGEHKSHNLGSGNNSLSLSADGSVLAMGTSWYGFNEDTGINLLMGQARVYDIGDERISGVSIQGVPAAVNTTDPFEVTFQFVRGVTDFSQEDLAVTNATVDDFTTVDASTYTATITPISICGDDDDITIKIPEGSVLGEGPFSNNLSAEEIVVTTGLVSNAKDITVQLAVNGRVTISPEDVNNGSTYTCDGEDELTLSLDRATFNCGDVGNPVTVTLTATNGNQTHTSTAVVTVENHPNVGLVAIAKDITVQLNAEGEAIVNPGQVNNGSGNGDCERLIWIDLDRKVFTCEDVGENTVVLTVSKTRQGGETATATAVVTVEENLEHVVAIAKDITVQLDPDRQVTISPEDIDGGSTYGCNNVPNLSLDRDTFTCDDVGTPVTVTLTATHGNNSDTATATVTVETCPAQVNDVFTVSNMEYKITSINTSTVAVIGISGTNISGRSSTSPSPEAITIPETATYQGIIYTVTHIEGAFNDNPDLSSVTVEAIHPPLLHKNALTGRGQIDLLVPMGKKQAYLANGWTGFRSITEVQILNVQEGNELNDFVVYPNPASDKVHIDLGSGQALRQVNIYTMTGAYLYSENRPEINTSHLSEGMYLFEIVTKTGDKSLKKVIIQ